MSLWSELKQRNVVRLVVAYAVASWLVVQVASILLPAFQAPAWVLRVIVLLLAVGLVIAVVLTWAYELTPDGLKRARDVTSDDRIRRPARRMLNVAVTTGLALAVVLLVLDNYVLDGDEAPIVPAVEAAAAMQSEIEPVAAAAASPGAGGAGSESIPSVAVLPFVNNSADASQEYFADGLSEQLIDSLGNIRDLRVTGRTSSFYFKGRNESLRTIGAALDVENVLEGSVRKAGDQLRISAQLVNARSGFQLWSETYERTLDDIFAIEDDIARSVAEALEITLGVGELGNIPGMTRDVSAYDEYLRARALFVEFTAESIRRAAEHYDRAVALDPSFGLALIDLSRMLYDGAVLAPDQFEAWRRRSAAAFERARDLAPEAPLVLAEGAFRDADRGAWLEAAEFFEERLPRLPATYGGSAEAWTAGGIFLIRAGRPSAAIPYLERARATEPLEGAIALYLGEAYAALGAYPAALGEFDRGIALATALDYMHGSALLTALATGDRAEIDKRVDVAPGGAGSDINVAMAGYLDNGEAALREIRALAAGLSGADDALSANVLAHWAAYYGDPALALELIDKVGVADNSTLIGFMIWRPLMADMRALPGFGDLVREMGYLDYWDKYGWPDFCERTGDGQFECS